MAKKQRRFLTAISVVGGIITLINEQGDIETYTQRGIRKLDQNKIKACVQRGMLAPNWKCLPELPSNISISFEDPELMGRARATFPIKP